MLVTLRLVPLAALALQVAKYCRPAPQATTLQQESPIAWAAHRATNALLRLTWPRFVHLVLTGLVRRAVFLLTSLGTAQAALQAQPALQGPRRLLARPLLAVPVTLLKERHIARHVQQALSVHQQPRSLWFARRVGILLLGLRLAQSALLAASVHLLRSLHRLRALLGHMRPSLE
jgi:hypothetical protein